MKVTRTHICVTLHKIYPPNAANRGVLTRARPVPSVRARVQTRAITVLIDSGALLPEMPFGMPDRVPDRFDFAAKKNMLEFKNLLDSNKEALG